MSLACVPHPGSVKQTTAPLSHSASRRSVLAAASAAFKEVGVQVAAGVPLHTGEQEGFTTFRIGLFGLDKLGDIDGTVARLEKALDEVDIV